MAKSAPDALHSQTKSRLNLTLHKSHGSDQEPAEVCQTVSRHLTKNSPSRLDTAKVLLVYSQHLQYLEVMTR